MHLLAFCRDYINDNFYKINILGLLDPSVYIYKNNYLKTIEWPNFNELIYHPSVTTTMTIDTNPNLKLSPEFCFNTTARSGRICIFKLVLDCSESLFYLGNLKRNNQSTIKTVNGLFIITTRKN